MVAFHESDNVDMAVLEDYNMNSISFEEWKKRNPHKYDFSLKKISEIKNRVHIKIRGFYYGYEY